MFKKNFSKTIFILIIISFALVGILELFRNNNNVVAQVGDKKITLEDFRHQLSIEKEQLEKTVGQSLSYEQLRTFGLDYNVINRMIDKLLLLKAAEKIGLGFSDVYITKIIKQDPTLQTNGTFDANKLEHFLHYNHLSENELLKRMNEQYIVRILVDYISKIEINFPEEYYKLLASYAEHQREIEVAEFATKPNAVSINKTDIENYYNRNISQFYYPEKRDITLLTVNPLDFTKNIKVSESEINEQYEARDYEDQSKTLAELRENITSSLLGKKLNHYIEHLIEELEDEIAGGEELSKIAAKFKLPFTNYENLAKSELSNKRLMHLSQAFAMSLEDEPLVKYDSTNNIYHIIKPTQILHSQPKPLKLVQNDIVNHLKKEQRYIINNKLYTEITDKLNKGTKFTDIMVEHNLKSTNHKIRYNDFKEPIENELLTEIQQLKPGEITHLFNIHGKTKFAFFKKIIISDHNGDINKMKDLIDNEIKNEIIQQYVNHLYQEYKVKVNANSINAL